MKARNLFSKVLSFALVAVMLLGLLPVAAFAAESTVDGSKVENGMYMNKYTTLESDGTYTITLEAFATGTTTTSTETKAVPLDIVLVLDQSGSMDDYISGRTTKMDALIAAVEDFIDSVHEDAVENEVDHRIAIVGFASTKGSYSNTYTNTEILSTSSVVNYGSATNNDYANAMVSVNSNGSVNTRLSTAVGRLATSGDTYSEYGFDMANKIFAQNSIEGTERQRVVVMFTDGYTAPSGTNDFKYSMANNAIANAKVSKDTYGATVYSIAVLNGANPDADINTNFQESDGWRNSSNSLTSAQELVAMNRYMHFASSNYPAAQSLQNGGERDADKDCYLVASDSEGLLAVFQSIFEDVIESSTSVTLDETSVVKDIVEPSAFNIPEGYNKDSDIKVYTEVVTAVEVDGVTTYTRSGDPVVYSDAKVDVDTDKNTIEVSNFDYAENFVAPSHDGKMLIIEIKGIEVTDKGFAEAEDDGMVDTNAMFSGIYSEDGVLLFPFDKPNVELGNKSYVVDYAKQFEMLVDDWGLASTNYIAKDTTAVKGEQTALDLIYGYVRQINNTKYTYTPNNMNWADYDTFYAFGKDNDSDLNKWAKVNVIPANNVYYEDTFVSTEGENGTPATVGIEYTGEFSIETSEENSSNGETANTPAHGGWENGDLADDVQFSDGSAHKLSEGTTVKFSFTGTGVDIYSYTDITTGAVRAILRDGQNTIKKYLVVDNLSETGNYYQIPTLSFNDLAYGTYTLELKVNSVEHTVEGVRNTYYLDGIRIYNPLGNNIEDETVKDAYQDELNAVFTEVRDILIDAGSFGKNDTVTGAVFIENFEVDGESDNGITDATVADFDNYGPENEVYLAAGQAIVFKVDTTAGNKYYVGLKAMEGKATTVSYTAAENNVNLYNIDHSTDLYYEVVPTTDGYVMIKNAGEAMLSITKIRITNANGAVASDWYKTATVSELAEYAADFSQISSVAGEFAAPMMPPAEVVVPETEVEAPEIEIEIEIETPAEPEADAKDAEVAKLIETIFDAFRGWFGR